MATSVAPTPRARRRRFLAYRPGLEEVVNEPLYDLQAYVTAGVTTQRFFSVPVGQSSKTYADTNLELAGQLSAGIEFEVRAIELFIFPGVNPALGQQNPAAVGGVAQHINDIWAIFKATAWLQFNILAKPYLRSPLFMFPPSQKLDVRGMQSDTTTAAGAQLNRVAYASPTGAQFRLTPVTLSSNMNFDITLNFPTAVATPSGQDARIGCVLRGIKTRVSQ